MRSGGKPPGARAARFVFPDIIVDWRSYEKATEVLQQARTGWAGRAGRVGAKHAFGDTPQLAPDVAEGHKVIRQLRAVLA